MNDEECSCRAVNKKAEEKYEEEVREWARACRALAGDHQNGFVAGPIFPVRPILRITCLRPGCSALELPENH